MNDISRLRQCLIGRQIETVTGRVSTIVDLTNLYVTIKVESSNAPRNIPWKAIVATQELSNKLGHTPSPSEIREHGVIEYSPAYTLPILLEVLDCLGLKYQHQETTTNLESERHKRQAALERRINTLQGEIRQKHIRLGDPALDPHGAAHRTLEREVEQDEALLQALKSDLRAFEND
jgi:hypothetical protein